MLPTIPGEFQEYVNGDVPPNMLIDTLPLQFTESVDGNVDILAEKPAQGSEDPDPMLKV
jgi:hypothetical protein